MRLDARGRVLSDVHIGSIHHTTYGEEHEDEDNGHDIQVTRTTGGTSLLKGRIAEGLETEVLDLADLEVGDVLNVTVAGFGNGVEVVFLQDSFRGPLLKFAGDGNDTASSVLDIC